MVFKSRKNLVYLFVAVLILVLLSIFFYRSTKKNKVEEVVVPQVQDTSPKRVVIGKSVEDREIESFHYGTGEKELLFVGGIHGGYEWNSVALSYELMDFLEQNNDAIPENLSIVVIPSLNPDGVFRVTNKEGRFAITDVSKIVSVLESARFNANNVDLNRNFDCNWKPESKWRSQTVSAGKNVFSEPEAVAIRDFVIEDKPVAVVFFHSQADTVFASGCGKILPQTIDIMNLYAKATGYKSSETFDSYAITGDAGDWLSTIGIPSIAVELKTHEDVEWSKNLLGIKALINYYSK